MTSPLNLLTQLTEQLGALVGGKKSDAPADESIMAGFSDALSQALQGAPNELPLPAESDVPPETLDEVLPETSVISAEDMTAEGAEALPEEAPLPAQPSATELPAPNKAVQTDHQIAQILLSKQAGKTSNPASSAENTPSSPVLETDAKAGISNPLAASENVPKTPSAKASGQEEIQAAQSQQAPMPQADKVSKAVSQQAEEVSLEATDADLHARSAKETQATTEESSTAVQSPGLVPIEVMASLMPGVALANAPQPGAASPVTPQASYTPEYPPSEGSAPILPGSAPVPQPANTPTQTTLQADTQSAAEQDFTDASDFQQVLDQQAEPQLEAHSGDTARTLPKDNAKNEATVDSGKPQAALNAFQQTLNTPVDGTPGARPASALLDKLGETVSQEELSEAELRIEQTDAFGSTAPQANLPSDVSNDSAHQQAISAASPGTPSATGPAGAERTTGNPPTYQPQAGTMEDQVVEGTLYTARAGHKSVIIKLNPDNLGEVRINLSTNGQQQLTARLIASSEDARQQLQHKLDSLQRSLEAQGVKVEHLSVVLAGSDNNLRDSGQQASAQQQTPQQGQQQSASQQFNQPQDQQPPPQFQMGHQGESQRNKSPYATPAPNGLGAFGTEDGSTSEARPSARNDQGSISILV